MNKVTKLDVPYCKECGVDSNVDGYINRIPHCGNLIDCYTCGGCNAYDDASEAAYLYVTDKLDPDTALALVADEDIIYDMPEYEEKLQELLDKFDEIEMPRRLMEVDIQYPQAKKIRNLISTIIDSENNEDLKEPVYLKLMELNKIFEGE